jgi:hypothetical protein
MVPAPGYAVETTSVAMPEPLTEEQFDRRFIATHRYLMRKAMDTFFAPPFFDQTILPSILEASFERAIFGEGGIKKDPRSWVSPKPWLRRRKGGAA